jgi:hypothetical protein
MPKTPPEQQSPFPGSANPASSRTSHRHEAHRQHRQQDRGDGGDGDDYRDEGDMTRDVLLRSGAVRRRYGNCSDMWLHRRLHDDSGFPGPIYIGRLRYWRLSDLLAWERAQANAPPQRTGCAARAGAAA